MEDKTVGKQASIIIFLHLHFLLFFSTFHLLSKSDVFIISDLGAVCIPASSTFLMGHAVSIEIHLNQNTIESSNYWHIFTILMLMK